MFARSMRRAARSGNQCHVEHHGTIRLILTFEPLTLFRTDGLIKQNVRKVYASRLSHRNDREAVAECWQFRILCGSKEVYEWGPRV